MGVAGVPADLGVGPPQSVLVIPMHSRGTSVSSTSCRHVVYDHDMLPVQYAPSRSLSRSRGRYRVAVHHREPILPVKEVDDDDTAAVAGHEEVRPRFSGI